MCSPKASQQLEINNENWKKSQIHGNYTFLSNWWTKEDAREIGKSCKVNEKGNGLVDIRPVFSALLLN